MLRALTPLLLFLLLGPRLSQAEELLRVWNWNDYIAPQVLTDFEKASGIKVEYHSFSTTEELDAALAAGTEIDVAVPSHDQLPTLIKAGRLQPLDFTQLPNRRHLDRNLLGKLAAFDPQNQYAIPYLWGMAGLAVNQPQAEAAFGGPLPSSWSLLFDPAQSSKLAGCGISLLDAPEETLAALMAYQGRSLEQSSPMQLQRASAMLDALRPHLRYIDSERYIDDLNNGKLCLALVWSGDAATAVAAGQPVRFIVPQEGSTLFIDTLAIPANAKRVDLAHRFIDYLMEPAVAALITSEVLYPNANQDASELVDSKLRNNPALYPDRKSKRLLFALPTLPEKLDAAKDAIWTKFKATP